MNHQGVTEKLSYNVTLSGESEGDSFTVYATVCTLASPMRYPVS
jgi:hypothetical protein